MPRAIWTGAVSFGLVNVPVKAYTAVRDHEVRFHQRQKGTSSRIRHKKGGRTASSGWRATCTCRDRPPPTTRRPRRDAEDGAG